MLRHIISVSLLAMTACASLIPTKASAISFTLTPLDSLQRNPGDTISFILRLDPQNGAGLNGVGILRVYLPNVFDPGGAYDSNELSSPEVQPLFNFNERRVTDPTNIAALIFNVTNPIRDGLSDVSAIRVRYQIDNLIIDKGITYGSSNSGLDVQPVPEPLTIFGTATALGCGVLFKRKSSKKTVS
jgi:hypothetical protein